MQITDDWRPLADAPGVQDNQHRPNLCRNRQRRWQDDSVPRNPRGRFPFPGCRGIRQHLIQHRRQCSGFRGCNRAFGTSAALGEHIFCAQTASTMPYMCTFPGYGYIASGGIFTGRLQEHLLP
ncbi:Uu.00g111820.m01.CDS01 [Anthostomella pinea]|uniref:Uu.00g111820.m01.CDS01 n=1 Tax=Anthostomella pinea TaxID=933095 RepID=A0AAI8VG81_9PEZI|nr:Uu.00g111820.m01.CDS01 [Anthostomella pinea]